MKRLVYSPSVNAWIKTDTGVFDLSPYITDFKIDRRVDASSMAEVTFRNPKITDPLNSKKTKFMFTEHLDSNGNVRPMFHPMDPIIITLTRLKGRPIQVFTGYCDTTPYVQLLPGVARLTASCTLKRLQYTYFDPALPFMRDFLQTNGWDLSDNGVAFNPENNQNGKKLHDGNIGLLLFKIMTEIGGWNSSNIFIEDLPAGQIGSIVSQLYSDNSKEAASSIKEFNDFLYSLIGASKYGSVGSASTGGTGGSDSGGGTGDPAAAEAYAKTREGTVGFAISDSSGNITAKYNENQKGYGASITKALVLAAVLKKFNNLSSSQKNLLSNMIKNSDNNSANTLYSSITDADVKKVASDAGMTNFELRTKSASAGYVLGPSQVTAADLAKLFAKIIDLIPSKHRTYAKGLMGDIQGEGVFGVVKVDSSAYGKNGWNSAEHVAHSGGNSGGRGIAITVFNSSKGDAYNKETINKVAEKLMTGGSSSGGGTSGAINTKWESAADQYSGGNYKLKEHSGGKNVGYMNYLLQSAPQNGHQTNDRQIVTQAANEVKVPFNVLWATYGAESSYGQHGSFFGLTGNHPGTGTGGNFRSDAYESARTWLRLYKASNNGHAPEL